MVNLEDCITVHMTLYHKKHKHVFGIETRSRLYFLVASSEDEMKEWVVAITTVCGLVLAEGMCVCVCLWWEGGSYKGCEVGGASCQGDEAKCILKE